jgi:hypothetical protein
MKPLILMLLLAVSVEAQSLPEVARKERARKANAKSVHVFTNEDAKGAPTRPESKTPAAGRVVSAEGTPAKPAEAAAAKPAPEPKATQIVSAPANDRVKRYNEDLARLKARVVQLGDESTAIQLRLVDLKNQFLAPVTDTITRNQVETKIRLVQDELARTEGELAATRRSIQVMEAQGPPKP